MILDRIVLHHFGSYYGRQEIRLTPPSADRPVVLFGGLNGVGKTTLLDALQLALYGKLAYCSNRGALAYEEYLRRSIHRSVDPKDGAAVELEFRHVGGVHEHRYRVHRQWSQRGSGIREIVEVHLDGKLDRVLTETWDEHVETILPRRISPLFFFDGEKIEAFADPQRSAELLATAIQSLLGIDLVEQLGTDLLVLERRKRTELQAEEDRQKVDQMRVELDQLASHRAGLRAERAAIRNELDRAEKLLRDLDERFRAEGGELFDQRSELERSRTALASELKAVEEELRSLAAGATPLLLVSDLLLDILEQDRRETAALRETFLSRELAARDALLLQEVETRAASADLLAAMQQFLERDRQSRIQAAETPQYVHLSAEGRSSLQNLQYQGLREARERAAEALGRAEALRVELADLDRKLARIPDQDAIASIIEAREQARAAVFRIQGRLDAAAAEIERLDREWEQRNARLIALIQRQVEIDFAQEDVKRILIHSEKIRGTLEKFRTAVITHHVERIEVLILESLQQLLRKQSLIGALRINPETFETELQGPGGEIIPPDRLSAGERQLLAVSMLWGLARAAGRPLPVIIDTPLGRLDGAHRSHLVESYFPAASHQVLLLSTDQEIGHDNFQRLQPWIGASYHLVHDDQRGATYVEPGYFWKEFHEHVA
jgi:DNA sulfur modification protein DndD